MQQEKKLRAVLVGCGGISHVWLQSAKQLPDLEVVGLVDIVEETARKKAAEYHLPGAVIGTDLTTVLQQTAPDIVFNCTIISAHLAVTLQALQHGCHVLTEKPLADTLEHAQQMIEAAQSARKLLAVMQNRRYHPGIQRLQAFLASGILGPLTTINSDFYLGAHFHDFRIHLPHVLLLDMAIHTFDAARKLSGADPLSVYCHEWNPAGSWYDHGASAVAIFELTRSIVYTYRGSWCSEGTPTSWESEWRIIGEKGSVKWDGAERFEVQVVRGPTTAFQADYQDLSLPPVPSAEKTEGHLSAIREFVACVRTGKTPETICTDNIRSLAMVFGAIQSAEEGRKIALND